MVRETRFSFDDGMDVNYPVPDDEECDDVDDFIADRQAPSKAPRRSRSDSRRNQPGDRRPDRRQNADGDWLQRTPPDEHPEAAPETGEPPQS